MESNLQYMQCKAALIDYIAKHELGVGSCLPAQRELCRILGHSMITVRRALFELEQVGVVKPVTGKGVFIQKDLTKQTNSGRILLLDINAPFREIDMGVRFLLQYVRKRGYEFRTVSCGEYPNDLTIREIEKASGLLVTGIITDSWKYFLRSFSCPIVNIGTPETHFAGAKTVFVDHMESISQAIRYFKKRGCRKFALINGPKWYMLSSPMHNAFKKHLAENELDYSEELELYASDENRSREVRDFLMKHHEKIDCILVESGVEPSLMTCFYEYGWNRVPVGVVGTSWNFIQPDNRLVTLFGAPEPVFQSAADILLDSFNKKDMQMWPDEMICIKTQILNHTEMERN